MKRQYFIKALQSILLSLVSFACFYFLPPAKTESTSASTKIETSESKKKTPKVTTTKETSASQTVSYGGLAKFWEMIGVGSLVFAVWLWRKELGINSIAGVAGPDIRPQPPGPPPSLEESAPPPATEMEAFVSSLGDDKEKLHVRAILDMLARTHSITPSRVAHELKVSNPTAEKLLLLMRRYGVLRLDGFPKATVFTLALSVENLTLDRVRDQVAASHNILSERRFVKVGRLYDIDSILTCEDRTYVVEAKYLSRGSIVDQLDNWALQLLNVAKEFTGKPVGCILAFTCKNGIDVDVVKRDVGFLTFDTGDVPIQVMVFTEDEIRRARKA